MAADIWTLARGFQASPCRPVTSGPCKNKKAKAPAPLVVHDSQAFLSSLDFLLISAPLTFPSTFRLQNPSAKSLTKAFHFGWTACADVLQAHINQTRPRTATNKENILLKAAASSKQAKEAVYDAHEAADRIWPVVFGTHEQGILPKNIARIRRNLRRYYLPVSAYI